MTVLDRTTLAPSDPSATVPSLGGPGGIPPAVGNSLGSGSSAGGKARLCLPGRYARGPDLSGGRVPGLGLSGGSAPEPGLSDGNARGGPGRSGGSAPGPGAPADEPPSACVRAASAALRPARGAGVLIRLLRCG